MRMLERPVSTLFAQGGDEFFLVATVQDAQKPAPEGKVAGAGLHARVTAGGRVVTFNGTKVAIADAP
jgi:hypothetical protein